jgi:hypothetical protein
VWKVIRIGVLLLVLICVAATQWLDRFETTNWDKPLWVGIFPLNGDNSAAADRYVKNLRIEDFAKLEEFFATQTARYGVKIERPIRVELYPSPGELPPQLEPNASWFQTVWWSLKVRWFARSAADVPGRAPSHIRIFVLYHDPEVNETVPHSLGMQKGLIGVVHAFADRDMAESNNIVIAHETLHTVGATDKYDLQNGTPRYPSGFAEPQRSPLYPQQFAEIMAGVRALSGSEHEMPGSLTDVLVGPETAAEIGWTRK